ncbi:CinA family protein [Aestuariivirga sp.]|jgi:nicotinamide-nucleotide amidase|uniref:CinA family protein n=1 Tax=Aestuariivirga sp. TaxID=2650926 RepID=UPI0037845FF5
MTFSDELLQAAQQLIQDCRIRNLRLATAESCTGGLISALITSIAGCSDVFDSGFVSYSNTAKTTMIGVPATLIDRFGAVSAEVALAMADGALSRSNADIAIAVTGIAGPGGGSAQKPVGLVYCAARRKGAQPLQSRLELGDIGRDSIRLGTAETAVRMAHQLATCQAP